MGGVVSAPVTTPVTIADAGKCMKCGFCMSACPVYKVDHVESHVARGRNMLIRMAQEATLPSADDYQRSLYFCLLCGRCLAVCPAKVPSPQINLHARRTLFSDRGPVLWQRLIYRGILNYRPLMAQLMGLFALIPGMNQKDGRPLRHMADVLAVLSGGISIPRISRPFLSKRMGRSLLPPDGVPVKGRVGFFPGCGFEFFFSQAGLKTAYALARAGFEVVYPEKMTCCGMAVYNAGDVDTARRMAEQNIDALSQFDHIVTGCATCGSTLKNYGRWFGDDDEIGQKARRVSKNVSDFSQFLVDQNYQSNRRSHQPVKVTYHDPCHLKWHQGISAFPRKILKGLSSIEYVEMEGADACCGLGGTFSIQHRKLSLAIQAKKMASIQKSGAKKVVTACPGCMIQLMDGVRRYGLEVEVVHLSQLL